MARAFEDVAVEQGWLQWVDDAGREWRAQIRGAGIVSVFRREGGTFAHAAVLRVRGKGMTPRRIAQAYAREAA